MPINVTGPLTQYRSFINTNEANIATNTADIATNVADIATNTADIATLDTQLSGAVVTHQEVFRASSTVTQEPVALDTPLQLSFGGAQSNAFFDLDAAGVLTCLTAGNYDFELRLVWGRAGVPGFADLFARGLLNGAQAFSSLHARLDDSDTVISTLFRVSIDIPASAVATFQIIRASINGGVNAGGVFAQPSPLAGWNPAPSCAMVITRNVFTLGS